MIILNLLILNVVYDLLEKWNDIKLVCHQYILIKSGYDIKNTILYFFLGIRS